MGVRGEGPPAPGLADAGGVAAGRGVSIAAITDSCRLMALSPITGLHGCVINAAVRVAWRDEFGIAVAEPAASVGAGTEHAVVFGAAGAIAVDGCEQGRMCRVC